ncbi:hypothetical protein PVAP13_9KG249513 [Panicum virgatum]|uniref:Uncharacterized protein n=1 Tax=Panicum virgatum TaxID=38727 RepID=A0A8T0NK24_PANVG|nr:hypothetical protein PVAP13_9KG249513 [Panicum virgatum]
MVELLGKETGLPMVICLNCSRARVREARSKKKNLNISRVYMKCRPVVTSNGGGVTWTI